MCQISDEAIFALDFFSVVCHEDFILPPWRMREIVMKQNGKLKVLKVSV